MHGKMEREHTSSHYIKDNKLILVHTKPLCKQAGLQQWLLLFEFDLFCNYFLLRAAPHRRADNNKFQQQRQPPFIYIMPPSARSLCISPDLQSAPSRGKTFSTTAERTKALASAHKRAALCEHTRTHQHRARTDGGKINLEIVEIKFSLYLIHTLRSTQVILQEAA